MVYPTDRALLSLSPEAFFQQIIVEQLQARAVVEGPNFYFGKDRAGNVQTLQSLCEEYNLQCRIVGPEVIDGEIVSSSRIRKLIEAGNIAQANTLLTQPFRMSGTVAHGAGRGATIGFPTANLTDSPTMAPGIGVYAGRAFLPGGDSHSAAIHIGPNPTFGENAVKIEVHLIDFTGDLYGSQLEVEFHRKLRDVTPFDSVEALIAQLKQDVQAVRNIP